MPAHVVIKAPAYTGVGFRKDSKKREAPEKGAVVKKRRGEKSIIDVTGSEWFLAGIEWMGCIPLQGHENSCEQLHYSQSGWFQLWVGAASIWWIGFHWDKSKSKFQSEKLQESGAIVM